MVQGMDPASPLLLLLECEALQNAMGKNQARGQVMVSNCILSPERFVSSEWQYGVCFGKLWLRVFVSWELKGVPLPPQEVRNIVVIWLVVIVTLFNLPKWGKVLQTPESSSK